MGKQFTIHEVAKHNGRDDVYVIIRGQVYDCTTFLEEHP